MIAVIDYGMGNVKSVSNALEVLSADFAVTKVSSDLSSADAIILPGVGAFAKGMDNLREMGFVEALNAEVIEKGKPYLGICLGLQFLASKSYEHGQSDGLGWINGSVVEIKSDDSNLKVPHMGWNNIDIRIGGGLYEDIEQNPTFYFVHSYHLSVDESDKQFVTGVCNYGDDLVISIQKNNIFGVQFHPEKSQSAGLKVLRNFLNLIETNK